MPYPNKKQNNPIRPTRSSKTDAGSMRDFVKKTNELMETVGKKKKEDSTGFLSKEGNVMEIPK